ncbi:hypothetical protein BDZ94DRAFT_1314122 [Collybia nuda]|uniref:Uncharacterized protein n=1 Tax=Collybia nuda TaxID=64659 RepID=A0A9P5XTZ4_9AGAR|nr:hypothetical protein BDZ94DRAFT_1314122 [Collybia nuda]
MALLPQLIHSILPDKRCTVQQLMDRAISPCTTTTRFARAKKYLSCLPPNEENIDEITSLLSPTCTTLKVLLQSVNEPDVKSIQCPHSPISGGKRYPLWVTTYWAELMHARDIQQTWKMNPSYFIEPGMWHYICHGQQRWTHSKPKSTLVISQPSLRGNGFLMTMRI